MSVDTFCSLVVLGPPSDIGAMEASLTAQSNADREPDVEGDFSWETYQGWPSLEVVRRGDFGQGLVVYDFSVRRIHPGGWIEQRAIEWPRMEFRAQYALDYEVVGRDWVTADGVIRSEWLDPQSTELFVNADGWARWLEDAGVTEGTRDAAEPVEIWLEPWLRAQRAQATPTRSVEPQVDEAAALALVRIAVAEGSLRESGPITLYSGTTLVDPERAAGLWLREADGDGPIAQGARVHLVSLSAILAAKDAGKDSPT